MRVTSWNVNGIRAIAKKGFWDWLEVEDPDVLLIQETKANENSLPADLVDVPGWFVRYHAAERKGYSGVSIWSRYEPDEWIVGLGDDEFDAEGRALSVVLGDLCISSLYFPNSQDGGKRLDYKLAFNSRLERFCAEQRERGRHVLLGGDFNVAHEEIDIARPNENAKSPGFLPEERAWFASMVEQGWVDTWRREHPDARDVYSWWSMRTRARERNLGWRIDYFVCDEDCWSRVNATTVSSEVEGSDHCPVRVELASPK